MKRFTTTLLVLALAVGLLAAPQARADISTAKAGSGGVTKNTFVKLSAEGTIVAASAVTDKVVGVCLTTASEDAQTTYATAGERVDVAAGEAVAVGDLVTAGSGGEAFVLDTDDTSTQRVAGVSLEADDGTGNVEICVLPSVAEQRLALGGNVTVTGTLHHTSQTGTKTRYGTPVRIVFLPTTGETLSYTVPTGYDLLVLDAYGRKTAAAGDAAEDQWALQNNDGSAANIFDVEELTGDADKSLNAFDNLDDSEYEVESGDTLDLVAGEDAGDDGADGIVVVDAVLKTAD